MARDGSGNYSLPAGNPVVTGTTIETTWANPTMADVATELQDSLSRAGKGGMLAPLKLDDGAVGGPGMSFVNEATSGLYRVSAGVVAMSILGVNVVRWNAGDKMQIWNGAAWVNNTLAEAGIASDTHTHAVNDLTDVFNSTPLDKHVLIYDGVTDNRYENRLLVEADISDLQSYLLTISGESITDLSDVLTTMTPTDGQVLTYDTVNGWQAESLAAGTDKFVAVSDNDTTPGSLIGPTNPKIVAGTGIQFTENNDGGNETLTITNTSPGGVQNIFETVAADTGSIIADTATDTLTLTGGTGIDTTATQELDTVTFDLNASVDDLNDVAVTSPTNGQILVYNTTGPNWENQDLSGIPSASDS